MQYLAKAPTARVQTFEI